MGPRPFERGNRFGCFLFDNQPMLQWGHLHSNVETTPGRRSPRSRCSGFNGATSIRTWKPLSARMFEMGNICFNGATSIRTWKRFRKTRKELEQEDASMGPRPFERGNNSLTVGVGHAANASMGPRPFERGNWSRRSKSRSRPARFNGATSIRTWKHGLGLVSGCDRRGCFNGATSIRTWKR